MNIEIFSSVLAALIVFQIVRYCWYLSIVAAEHVIGALVWCAMQIYRRSRKWLAARGGQAGSARANLSCPRQ